MRLTKSLVKNFEKQQKSVGTKVALYNVIWELAFDILQGIGVKSVTTSFHPLNVSKPPKRSTSE